MIGKLTMRKHLMRTSPATALALGMLASACSVGPNFTRPAAPSVAGYTPPSEPRASEPVPPEFTQQIAPGTSPAAAWWSDL